MRDVYLIPTWPPCTPSPHRGYVLSGFLREEHLRRPAESRCTCTGVCKLCGGSLRRRKPTHSFLAPRRGCVLHGEGDGVPGARPAGRAQSIPVGGQESSELVLDGGFPPSFPPSITSSRYCFGVRVGVFWRCPCLRQSPLRCDRCIARGYATHAVTGLLRLPLCRDVFESSTLAEEHWSELVKLFSANHVVFTTARIFY